MNKTTLHKLNIFLTIFIFLSMIYFPFFGTILQKDKTISPLEKRTLAKLPTIPNTKKQIKQYPKSFETYYSDHFGFRDYIIENFYAIKTKFDKNSLSPDVTFGKDNWMFLGGIKKGYSNYENPIGDVMNIDLYTPTQLINFATYIKKVSTWLKSKNIVYIFIIAPNKHTIYFDKLPSYITKQNQKSATDQLVNYLKKHTDIPIVDLRATLIEQKDNQQLYYKTDTHWNYLGANIAQYKITKDIEKLFPNKIKPYLYTKQEFTLFKKQGGDLATFAKQKDILEDDYRPIFDNAYIAQRDPVTVGIRETFTSFCKDNQLNTLIFRDSFFTALVPYIERKFKYSTYIWEKLSFEKLKKYTDIKKPDIVIEEWVERSFPYVPNTKGF